MGRKAGLNEAKLRSLNDFETSAELNELEKILLRYAVAMTVTPVEVPDELFKQLRGRFNETQIVELTSSLAWENWRARFNHALEIGSAGFSKGQYCPLPTRPEKIS